MSGSSGGWSYCVMNSPRPIIKILGLPHLDLVKAKRDIIIKWGSSRIINRATSILETAPPKGKGGYYTNKDEEANLNLVF